MWGVKTDTEARAWKFNKIRAEIEAVSRHTALTDSPREGLASGAIGTAGVAATQPGDR
jgi:hypothetical protein